MLYASLAVLFLLMASAFTSGTETAMTAATPARIHHLANSGNRRAKLAKGLLEHKESLIGSLLLGNNLFNVLATALAADLMIKLAGDAGIAYATLIMTVLVVIFAEVLPKTYAIRNPERMALAISPLANILVLVLSPVTKLVQFLINGAFRLFGVSTRPDLYSSPFDVVRGTIDMHAEQGTMTKQDRDMLGGILDLSDVEVREIMTHRRTMETIDADQPLQQILEQVVASPYSRFPIWRGEPESIIGVLHAKDLLTAVQEHGRHARRPKARRSLSASLVHSRHHPAQAPAHRLSSAPPASGAGGGRIRRPRRPGDAGRHHRGDRRRNRRRKGRRARRHPAPGRWFLSGQRLDHGARPEPRLRLETAGRRSPTIAGLVIHEAQRIPEVGQNFAFHGFRFVVLRRQRNQIVLLKVIPPGPEQTADKAAKG